MHELTEQDRAVLQALTIHRFPDDKKPNVVMLCGLLLEQVVKFLGEDADATPEERDQRLSLACDIMETILRLRISNNGQTK